VARYVHDCMRDPGLVTLPMGTHVNDTPANRLYLEWIGVLAEFVVKVWIDKQFSRGDAEALTRWAVTECLPSAPPIATPQVTDSTFRLFLSKLLIHGTTVDEKARVSDALVYLRKLTGLSDAEYARAVTEVLDGF